MSQNVEIYSSECFGGKAGEWSSEAIGSIRMN